MVNDHNMLWQLRSKYFHWSAKFGDMGLEPNFDFTDKFNIRRFRKQQKIHKNEKVFPAHYFINNNFMSKTNGRKI